MTQYPSQFVKIEGHIRRRSGPEKMNKPLSGKSATN